MQAYGACVVANHRGEAERLLAKDFTASSYRTGMRLLADDARRRCARDAIGANGSMRGDELLFAGAVAEALIERGGEPLNSRLARASTAEQESFSATDSIALCLARSLPDELAALYAAEPGSPDEVEASAPLAQAVTPCATAAGLDRKFDLSTAALRAMTATAAYRLITSFEGQNA
jgi:hypothetical protein